MSAPAFHWQPWAMAALTALGIIVHDYMSNDRVDVQRLATVEAEVSALKQSQQDIKSEVDRLVNELLDNKK